MKLNNVGTKGQFIVRTYREGIIVEDWTEPKAARLIWMSLEDSMRLRQALEEAERAVVRAAA